MDGHGRGGGDVHGHRGAHGDGRLLVHGHGHGGQGHVGKVEGLCRDPVARRAGEGGRVQRVMPRVATSDQFSVGHVGQAKSRLCWWVHYQDAATLHIKRKAGGFAMLLLLLALLQVLLGACNSLQKRKEKDKMQRRDEGKGISCYLFPSHWRTNMIYCESAVGKCLYFYKRSGY